MKRLVLASLPVFLAVPAWGQTIVPAGRAIGSRYKHTATLLQDGNVLVAGGLSVTPLSSAEIYDFRTGSWTPTGNLTTARANHTATLLPDGTVLLAGGRGAAGVLGSSETYDRSLGAWRTSLGALAFPREGQTGTLLRTGEVLVTGGLDAAGNALGASEIYNPASRSWRLTGPLTNARSLHTATLLSDGRVLVTGGLSGSVGVAQQEIFDPATGSWGPAASLPDLWGFGYRIAEHVSLLLPGGRVLIAGGSASPGFLGMPSSALYDPAPNTVAIGPTHLAPATQHAGVVIPDGRAVILGGIDFVNFPLGQSVTTVQIYNPAANAGAGGWTLGPALVEPRTLHTATLLPNGKVLLVGGINYARNALGDGLAVGQVLASVEIFDPAGATTGAFVGIPTGFLGGDCGDWPGSPGVPGCVQGPPVLLPSGQVLFVDKGVLYDPSTGVATATGAAPFIGWTVTLLVDGRVLMTGGTVYDSLRIGRVSAPSNAAALFNPATGTWTPAPNMSFARTTHTATLLSDGRVLVAGGSGDGSSAEIFDATAAGGSGSWTLAASMNQGRSNHTANLLGSGLVLVAGGGAADDALGVCELFDPTANGGVGTWTTTGSLGQARTAHTATLLEDGRVLAAGGWGLGDSDGVAFRSAEIYDPAQGSWSFTGQMVTGSFGRGAALLANGDVLVVGGGLPRTFTNFGHAGGDAEIFRPSTGSWRLTGGFGPFQPNLLPLPDGRVLMAGGLIGVLNDGFVASVEAYDPQLWAASRRATLNAPPSQLVFGNTVTLTGTGLRGDSEASGGNTRNSAVNVPLVKLRALEGGRVTWLVPDSLTSFGPNPLTLSFSKLPSSLNPGFHMATVTTAGLPSVPVAGGGSLVGVTCAVAITTPPAAQTVPLGTSATFSVVAQGARAHQWRKDGIPIPGATGTSYATPPIQGADSGSLYDVVVSGPCASATSAPAVLTVADSAPPVAAVVAPSGGEYWLLTPTAGPVSTEQVAWSMSDNVRVCQVRVSLLYSNDGGVSYLPAPTGGGLPQVLGAGGSCAFPGVSTTNLTYAIPTTYPSGKSGSLYRLQVEVFDQVGQSAVARSENPFYIVQANPDVRTLILSNTSRMQSVMGVTPAQASALDTKLRNLSVHPRVQGVAVDLGLVSALGPYYAALDAAVASNGDSVKAANDLLFATNGVHAQILSRLRAFPGVRYVILVGDDRIIPLARVPDGTALFDESNYPAGGDLSGLATAVGQALQAKRFLSDDPLGLVTAFGPEALSTGLFLPDLAVGRLVETPEEITTAIATFIGQDGVLDLAALDPTTGHKVLVTGYDFLQDSAVRIRDRWKAVLGAAGSPDSALAPVDGSLIGGNWGISTVADRRAALLARVCGNGTTRYGIASLSGHASHSLEGVPAEGGSFTDIEGLAAADLLGPNACGVGRGIDLAGAMVYAVGCHGGLPVPGSNPADGNRSVDLPQSLLSRGVVAYVANSGYGWGPRFGPGYGKRLMEILTELLAVPGTVVTGDAVRAAKLRYFDQTGSPDPYDSKSLMQWTLYGFPMYAVKTGIAAPGAAFSSALAQSVAAPETASKASVRKVGGVLVARRAAAVSAVAASLPPSLTQLELRFDFTAAGVYEKRGASGSLLTAPGCSDPNGCYYTLNGLATGRTDLPVQPYFVYDSRLSGTSQHGVLWKGGTYDQESGWKPVITELVSNGGDGSDHGVAPRQISSNPTATRRIPGGDPTVCAASDSEVNSLVVSTGEVLTAAPADAPYSTERRFRDVNLESLYFNNTSDPNQNCDRSGPVIAAGPLPGGLYHSLDGTLIQWAVPASDAAGVWRVIVVVNDNSVDALGRGRWSPVELTNDGSGTWRGTFTAAGSGTVTYMIQAVDNRGNVSWLDFTVAAVAPLSGLARTGAASTGLPSSGVPLSIPLPVDVVVSGPAGPRVDAFSPPSGLVGASVSIFGRNFAGTTQVAFNGTAASYIEVSPTNLMATVPAGATTGPISVTTALGIGTSATSFTVVPGLNVADVTVTRPVSGTVAAAFTVSLAPTTPSPVTVQYKTVDGTARAGVDYTATTGTLTFGPNASARTVNVPVLGNGSSGPPRTFSLELFGPVNAGLLRARADGTILRPWRVSDWNGDGKADVLWQQDTTGELALWLFDATKRIGALSLSPDRVPDRKQWTAGAGDFNADGQTDLAFQHQTTGAVSVWLMNGLTRTSAVTLSPTRPAAWRLAAVADWNADNGGDLVWQNASTGAVEVWYLNGTAFASSAAVTPSRPVAWRVAGVADWNGDGKPDLLWQNQSTGDLDVWYMNGTARVSSATLSPSKPSSPFKLLSAIGDFTGDGKPDLLFRDPIFGSLALWVMNGTSRASTATPTGINYPGEQPTTPGRVLFDVKWQVVLPK